MTTDLLPCPFCGMPAVCVGGDSPTFKLARVHCTTCFANTGRNFNTRDEAIEAWNQRAPTQRDP